MPDTLDQWLDDALAEYSNASLPLGFEARTVARLHKRKPGYVWTLTAVFATAAVVVLSVLGIRAMRADEMPVPRVAERISVPAIHKTQMTAQRSALTVVRIHESSTRGVPIVAAPITRQEEAILRVVRNARATQLASLAATPKEFKGESIPLAIQELNIPTMFGEEK